MEKWYILDRGGNPISEESLPERPNDAKLEEGQPFRPWYKEDGHIHIENKKIDGIHAFGDLDTLQKLLVIIVTNEEKILEKYGVTDDIMIDDVKKFLNL